MAGNFDIDFFYIISAQAILRSDLLIHRIVVIDGGLRQCKIRACCNFPALTQLRGDFAEDFALKRKYGMTIEASSSVHADIVSACRFRLDGIGSICE